MQTIVITWTEKRAWMPRWAYNRPCTALWKAEGDENDIRAAVKFISGKESYRIHTFDCDDPQWKVKALQAHAQKPRRFHRVFRVQDWTSGPPLAKFVMDIPWGDDDDQGLPGWYFKENDLFTFEVDLDKDMVEWVPECGPAPCWKDTFSKYSDNQALLEAWETWFRATY